MCLLQVYFSANYNKTKKQYVNVGYKVFTKQMDGPFFNARPIYKTGVWIKDNKHGLIGSNKLYQHGFHLFLNKNDAFNFMDVEGIYGYVFKINFKNIVAIGTQHTNNKNCLCIVAREIKLLHKVKPNV